MKKIKKRDAKKISKFWFVRKRGRLHSKTVPVTWQGYLTLILFLALNFFSVFYFQFPFGDRDSIFAFLTVLFLSIFIFSVVSIKKTKGTEKEI